MHLLEEYSVLCSEVDFGLAELENYVRSCVYDSLSVYTSSLRVRTLNLCNWSHELSFVDCILYFMFLAWWSGDTLVNLVTLVTTKYQDSPQEMMTAASALLQKYVAPIQLQELKKSDKIKLFHRIQPELVTTMTKLSCVPSFKTSLELPYNLRILLICSFLASHNPAKLDKRFFCKGKSSRRKVKSRKGSKLSDALKGPKTFPLDRLLAIHCSITQVSTCEGCS